MKILLLVSVIFSSLFSSPSLSQSPLTSGKDSTAINHVVDGNTAEWPNEKFETDKITGIKYAIDNDKETLFLSMKISGYDMLKNVMSRGMDLYIDTKGKKKAKCGISFPLIKENESNPDKMANMRLFGFNGNESLEQPILVQGTANIAFAWDSLKIFHIEYSIPLKMLEEPTSSLHQKDISFGWKIKEGEMPVQNQNATRTITKRVAVPAGQSPPSNPSGNTIPSNRNNLSPEVREHSFWSKFTIIL